MKALLLAAVFTSFVSPAFASQVGCQTTVSISVSQMLHADPKSNEVLTDVQPVPQRVFGELSIWVAYSSGNGGIPSNSKWAVITRKGPQGTCTVENVILDTNVQ